ncbi:hypothetical protein [Nocardia harenae]|uniref:hypothetical protein n=1 Tax=Nocardia harenae TaxID=358707 RepID=UPI00082E3260|nr:hypothetical protein [Nocardia harenae]
MLIWGWQRQVLTLAVLAAFCGACRTTGPHGLRKLVTKFTLFFVPLFPISSRSYLECPVCGVQSPVPAGDVPNLVAQANQPPVPGQLIHTVPSGAQGAPPPVGWQQPAAPQGWQQPAAPQGWPQPVAQQNWQQPAPVQGWQPASSQPGRQQPGPGQGVPQQGW